MRKRALIGAGGHAREVMSVINRNYPKTSPISYMFVEDEYYRDDKDYIFPLSNFYPELYEVMIAIGDPKVRERIVKSLPEGTKFFTYIDPTSIIDNSISIGEGSYIGPNSILTTNINIGNHAILNRGCQVGHDVIMLNYVSMMPGSVISGGCI
jgi:acetyltransferase-like isoleucine patch superfamily enzyme